MLWSGHEDRDLDQRLYDDFRQELYGVLVSLTEGEPLGLIKWLVEEAENVEADGFKAILLMIQRFDPKTTGSMLRQYIEVVSPPPIAKGSGPEVIRHVQESLVTCVAPLLTFFADPVRVACFARVVCICLASLFVEVQRHT